MDPFDFFKRLSAPPLDMDNLPPEAATLDGMADAVEEMTRAFNIIAKYDSRAMAATFNYRVMRGDWDFGPSEEINWPQVIMTAQRVKIWVDQNPDLVRLVQDLRTIGVDWPVNSGPVSLQ